MIHNGWFATTDPGLYGAIIAEYRPIRIIEMGFGYSTVVAGGDGPFLFCQNYGYWFYSEQYVLQALLTNSSKFSVLFSTHAISREHADEMQVTFGPRVGKDPLFFGASLWMDTVS